MKKTVILGFGLKAAAFGFVLALSGANANAAIIEGVTLDCGAFTRNPDGTWSTIANATIDGPQSKFVIGPRTELRIGQKFQGLDIAAMLEAGCR